MAVLGEVHHINVILNPSHLPTVITWAFLSKCIADKASYKVVTSWNKIFFWAEVQGDEAEAAEHQKSFILSSLSQNQALPKALRTIIVTHG